MTAPKKVLITGHDRIYPAVLRITDYEMLGSLRNAERINRRSMFIGNRDYPILDVISVLDRALRTGVWT